MRITSIRFFGAAIALAATASATSGQSTSTTRGFAGGDRDGGVHSVTIAGMPISPRAVALGEAMGAVDRDPSVIFYNAAGLIGLKSNAFSVTGSQRFGLTQLVSAAVAFPTEIASFGIAARAFNGGTIEQRVAGEQVGGTLRAYQLALEGGGALELAPWWRWGGTLMYAQETLANQTQGTILVNSGMQFPNVFGRLTLAGGMRNLGLRVDYDQRSQGRYPPFYAFGAAGIDLLRHRDLLQTPLLFRGQKVIIDAKALGQINFNHLDEPTGHLGIETTANGVVIARIGYETGDDNRKGLSLGAGVNVGQFRLEYGFKDLQNGGAPFFSNDPVGDSHNVGFTFFFGGPETNQPVVPVIVTQAVDTAALNEAVRRAIEGQLAALRPLLDSLRSQRVEITNESDLVSRYVVPVHFGFDSSVVRDSDYAVLGQIADVIRRIYPNALVTIEGFADPAGSVQYNLALSRRRADAVKQVMVTRYNLPAGQFKTVGYGKQSVRQVTPGARRDEAGAQGNRRVTFTIDATQHF
jgi:outer membrane protein OmpA-like peptidoglycan-associated protein